MGKRPKGFIISTGKIQKADITCRSEFPTRIQQTRLRRKHLANLRGDIFIHGEDTKPNFFKRDWTAGCIAVKNREIREIYALVKVGTPILIRP